MNLIAIRDSSILKLWVRGLEEPESLTDTEALQFSMNMRALFNQFTRVHRLCRAALIEEADWELYAREAATLMGANGGQLHFQRNSLPPDFERDIQRYAGLEPNIDLRLGRQRTRSRTSA